MAGADLKMVSETVRLNTQSIVLRHLVWSVVHHQEKELLLARFEISPEMLEEYEGAARALQTDGKVVRCVRTNLLYLYS